MRVSRKYKLQFIFMAAFAIGAGLYSLTAVAKPEFWILQKRGTLDFLSEANYFSTKANYASSGGSYADLPNGGSYKIMQAQFGAQYAVSTRFYFGGNLGVARAESYDGFQNRSKSEPTDVRAWTQYLVTAKPFRVAGELVVNYPLNVVDVMTDNVLTGEGVLYVQPGAWITKRWRSLESQNYLGFKYQGDGRADLLLYRVGAQYWMRKFFLGASLNGETVVFKDENTDDPLVRLALTQRVNGRSLRYYAVNPNLLEVDGWLGLKFSSSSQAVLGVSQTINGKNTAEGMNIHAGLRLTLAGNPRVPSSPAKAGSPTSFEAESEDYDETLFREEPKPEPRKRKPRPNLEETEKQMLDETMRELEQ